MHARLRRRPALLHGADERRVGRVVDDPGEGEDREQEVHDHARRDHHGPGAHRLRVEAPFRRHLEIVLPTLQLLQRLLFAHPGHFHVAAQRQCREHVLGLADPHAPYLGAEADRETRHRDASQLGGDEVAQLVDHDQNAEDDDEGEDRAHLV